MLRTEVTTTLLPCYLTVALPVLHIHSLDKHGTLALRHEFLGT